MSRRLLSANWLYRLAFTTIVYLCGDSLSLAQSVKTSTDDGKSISNSLPTIRLRAGSTTAFKDSEGHVWLPDVASDAGGFDGGKFSQRPDDLVIKNTKEQGLYRSLHWGMDSFSCQLPNGKYVVNLHFAETYDGIGGPGDRVFSIKVQDKELNDFDVWEKAGGPNRAYIQRVPVEISEGKLKITFTPIVENPEINGIEIIPADTFDPIEIATITKELISNNSSVTRSANGPTSRTNPVPIGDPIANVKIERAFPNLNFPRPIFITYPPDGTNRIAVISEYGAIYMFPNDPSAEDAYEVLDIKDKVVYRDNQPEEGFLGLAFHPKFKENGVFFVYYTTKSGPPHTAALMRYHMSKSDPNKADPDSAEEIFHSPPKPDWNHNGGTILFGPDGYLYLCLGDGGAANDPRGNAQNISKVLGKVLRIDVDHEENGKKYAIPKDNPFADVPDAAPEVWALGLRNIWRMSFDRLTQKLWAGDVGQDTWEEVDIIERGHNYEWNQREGFHPLRAKNPKPGPPPENTYGILSAPLFDYNHSLGKCVVGGHVYRGKDVRELYGAYVFADHITGRVYALWYDDATSKVTSVQPVDPPKDPSSAMPIFSFGEDEPGEMYFTNTAGRIMHFRSTANDTKRR